MNKRTILALAGFAQLSLSVASISELNSPSFVEAQSEQSNQNGNTTITIVNNNNLTMNDVKQHSCMRS